MTGLVLEDKSITKYQAHERAKANQFVINCKSGSHQHILAVAGTKGESHYHCVIDSKIYTFNISTKAIIGDGVVSVFPK